MAKPTGFLDYEREAPGKRPVSERILDYREVEEPLAGKELELQAARCMDCGTPYCHACGCPLASLIPEWNDLVYRGKWKEACDVLHSTNNFPEVTGRICPALCEASCTLSINAEPVTVRQIELQITERGWQEGWIKPQPARRRTGKSVAVIGSGPAALAAAQQLARKGHRVVVYEKDDRIGGILRYGIPDFKLEKWILDRRLEQMRAEGVEFEAKVNVGVDISLGYLRRAYDAILLAVGSATPRDLKVPGRELGGIHFALEFLKLQNRINAGEAVAPEDRISAQGKHVVVVGGGDTGADCIGTSRRQGAASITQIDLLPKPPDQRAGDNPWPDWPLILRTGSSHEEGCERLWSVDTKEFIGRDGRVAAMRYVKLQWGEPDANGRRSFSPIAGSEFELKADLVLLAMGFVHVEHGPLVKELGLALDPRGNIVQDKSFMTSVPGVFAAGDCVTGTSLVVRAIHWGRHAADGVDAYLRKR